MERKASLLVRICTFLLIMQVFMTISALKKASDMREFTVDNHRTHKKQHYLMNRVIDDGMPSNDNDDKYAAYSTDYIDVDELDKLPSLMVDYANRIRNDIIMFDDSVETTKRGNEKFKRGNEKPCTCENQSNEVIDLGEEYFPRTIETKICNKKTCQPLHRCQERWYSITALKRIGYPVTENEISQLEVPYDLKHSWITVKKPVITSCVCIRDYIEKGKQDSF